jgi:hypothetical protein
MSLQHTWSLESTKIYSSLSTKNYSSLYLPRGEKEKRKKIANSYAKEQWRDIHCSPKVLEETRAIAIV